MATADLRAFGARPAVSRYTKDGGRLRIIRSRPPSSAMEPPSSAHGLADLGGEEPGLLLELADEVLDDAGGGGVLGVDVLVHTAQGADNGLDGGDDVGHSLAGEDLPLGGGRDGGGGGDGGRAAVGDGVDGAHALGDLVGTLAGDVDDVIQVEVDVAEVRADDVPVDLLAHELEGDEVGQDALEVVAQGGGGGEGEVDGRCCHGVCVHGHHFTTSQVAVGVTYDSQASHASPGTKAHLPGRASLAIHSADLAGVRLAGLLLLGGEPVPAAAGHHGVLRRDSRLVGWFGDILALCVDVGHLRQVHAVGDGGALDVRAHGDLGDRDLDGGLGLLPRILQGGGVIDELLLEVAGGNGGDLAGVLSAADPQLPGHLVVGHEVLEDRDPLGVEAGGNRGDGVPELGVGQGGRGDGAGGARRRGGG